MVIFRKAALNELDVFTVLVLTRTVTVTVLLAALLCTGRAILIRDRRAIPFVLLLGFLNFVLNWLAGQGQQWTTATNSAVLFKTDVLFTVVLGWILLGEKVRLGQVPLILCAFTGCMLVIVPDAMVKGVSVAEPRLAGNVLCIVFGLVLTINSMVIKGKLGNVGKIQLAFWNALIGMGFFLVRWFMASDVPAQLTLFADRPDLWGILLVAGLAATVTFLSYYQALWHMPVWVLRVILLLSPVFVIVCARWHWGAAEAASPAQIVGIVLLLGGTISVVLSGRRKTVTDGEDNGGDETVGPSAGG